MRRLAALAGLATAGIAIRRYMSARDDLAAVSPELRRAVLPFVTPPSNARLLPLNRFVARLTTPSGCEVETAERFVGDRGLRAVVTTPHDGGPLRPAVLWIHGGGYVLGSPQFERFWTGRIAREIGAVVVSPDYRLAPEHPYPAALDDCMATLRWMRDHADELGIDPGRVAVGGASAGGGLSAAVAQRSHDEGISLRAQVLVYPMLDDRTVLRADHAGRGRFMWTPASSRFGWTSYLGREPRMSDAPEYAVPARREQLEGLAPAWIGVGDLDLLYDEDVAYAGRLRAAGVPCELVTVPGMYHAADGLAPTAPSMQRFRASMLDHLRTYLQAS